MENKCVILEKNNNQNKTYLFSKVKKYIIHNDSINKHINSYLDTFSNLSNTPNSKNRLDPNNLTNLKKTLKIIYLKLIYLSNNYDYIYYLAESIKYFKNSQYTKNSNILNIDRLNILTNINEYVINYKYNTFSNSQQISISSLNPDKLQISKEHLIKLIPHILKELLYFMDLDCANYKKTYKSNKYVSSTEIVKNHFQHINTYSLSQFIENIFHTSTQIIQQLNTYDLSYSDKKKQFKLIIVRIIDDFITNYVQNNPNSIIASFDYIYSNYHIPETIDICVSFFKIITDLINGKFNQENAENILFGCLSCMSRR